MTSGDESGAGRPSARPELASQIAGLSPQLLALLAKRLKGTATRAVETIPLVPRDGPLQLSFAQERLWFLDQLEPGSASYNMPGTARLTGKLDASALELGLREVMRRHEVLRTTFATVEGRPTVVIADTATLELPVVDLRSLDAASRDAVVRAHVAEEARGPFDLSRGPLVRAKLLQLADEEHLLLFTVHHIAADGWSLGVLMRETGLAYDAIRAGRPAALPPLALQYVDYAAWQRAWLSGDALEKQLGYWRGRLAGAPPALELPTDRPRGPHPSSRGGRASRTLSVHLSTAVTALGAQEGATPFMTLVAATQLLLGRLAGQTDVVLGTPIANRTLAEIEPLIGLFMNAVALRTDLGGEPTVRTLLTRVKETCLEAYAHRDVPFELVVQAVNPQRDLSRPPLFQVFVNMLNFESRSLEVPGLGLEMLESDALDSKLDLTLYVSESRGALELVMSYNADLFSAARMAELLAQLELVLQQMTADPDRSIAAVSTVTSAARAVLPDPTAALDASWVGAVHERFAAQARRTPDRTAVTEASGSFSYRVLDECSNRLAHELVARGVRPGDVVAIHAHRSAALVWAVLGVLQAGAAFVMLDPTYPSSRLVQLASAARPRAAIRIDSAGALPAELEALLDATPAGMVVLPPRDRAESVFTDRPATSPAIQVGPDDLAYVAFTSGSTGGPKGILGRHGPLSHFQPWRRETFGLTADDHVSMLSGVAHDPLHRDIFVPLDMGASIHVPAADDIESPGGLARWMRRESITVTHLTPAMGRLLAEAPGDTPPLGVPSLRRAFFVGDVLTTRDVAMLRRIAPGVRAVNYYGATETQQALAYHVVPEPSGEPTETERALEGERLPLGRGAGDVQILVLTSTKELAGFGEAGEIYVRSPHLARAYLGDERLTRERFLRNPFSDAPDDRVYATGDLGRYRLDGSVEPMGRADGQVKIRGFRVEPTEVEVVLARHPSVREVVVVGRDHPSGEKRLVAYVAPADAPSPVELRALLKDVLPGYMVPSAFVVLDALPRTPSGKIDRRVLPEPEEGAGRVFTPPRGPEEEAIASILQDVLRVARVGAHDDFFELGGHSLLAMQVVSRIRKTFGVELALRSLFETPTVAELAERVQAALQSGPSVALDPIERVPRGDELTLSFGQERLWFLEQLAPGTAFYNIPGAVRIRGVLRAESLERALGEVVSRHEVLRTVFTEVDGRPRIRVDDTARLELATIDMRAIAPTEQDGAVRALVGAEALKPFVLDHAPLVRASLLRLSEEEHVLLVTMHHIVSDGWSIGVFVRETALAYEAFAAGRPSPLAELPVQYADYAAWQRKRLSGEQLERQLDYWRTQLADTPAALELPIDRPRPPAQTFRGALHRFELSAELRRGLGELARAEGATLFMTLLAGFQLLLARHARQNDVVVGTPIAGRTRAETEELVGFFVNTLAMRTRLGGNPTFRQLVGRVKETAFGAYAHQDVPFERLVQELSPERDPSRSPLFQVMFALQNAPSQPLAVGGLELAPLELDTGTAKFDLTLTVVESETALSCALDYNTDLFDAATVERLAGHLRVLLEGAVARPDRLAFELPMLPAAERRQVVVDFNATQADYPEDRSIHEMFEDQVDRTPDAIALVSGGARLSYAELDRRANQVARRLERLGVRPESLVGVCLERSIEMVVALLGVLKAGAAYVPLDPAYPKERLAFMLGDSSASLVVTQTSLADVTPADGARLMVDADRAAIASESDRRLPRRAGPSQLAYLIYTSGSTGRAKGVAIEHRNAVTLLHWAREVYQPSELAGVLASTSICFDLSVYEMFVPLAWGGTVILARDALQLPDLEAAGAVTLINTVPSAMTELVRMNGLPPSARTVNLAGEPLQNSLVRKIYDLGTVDRVVDLYGPSEDTTYSTFAQRDGRSRATIGRPLANTQVYLLDVKGEPVASGIAGDLCIGGHGLARGYFARPDLSADRFVPNHFATTPGARLYRTGDLARWLPGGQLEFLGRLDNQVKVRGFRIELGEIETAIASHPDVREVVVVVREYAPGERRLVAYVVGTAERPSTTELRAWIKQRLPEYMVPSAFVPLEALPQTPNGKVDRKALPAPETSVALDASHVAPITAVERAVAGVWESVLGLPRVGRSDDFFDLGGHSLLATQVVSRVRQALGVDLPLRSLFEAPTLVGFAERAQTALEAKGSGPAAPPLRRIAREGELALSFGQERLWFLEQLAPGSAAYNMPGAVRMTGKLDASAVARSLEEVIRRHEVLRTSFSTVDGRPVQVIGEVTPLILPIADLRGLDEASRAEVARQHALEEARAPFDLSRGPVVRAKLLRLAEEEHVLLFTTHHIASDGWSAGVLVRELAALYDAYANGKASPLPELPIQYADYAHWQRGWLVGGELERQLAYWRKQLAGAPPTLELPADRPRSESSAHRGATESFRLSSAETDALLALCRRTSVTPFVALLALFDVLIHRYTGLDDIVVGSPIANRTQIETEPLVGFFANTLVLRSDLSGAPTFEALLLRVREMVLGAFSHQDAPFERLVQELQPERQSSRMPLFQVGFVLQTRTIEALEVPGLRLEPINTGSGSAKIDLLLSVVSGPTYAGHFEYSAELFEPSTIKRMVAQLRALLADAAERPHLSIDQLSLGAAAEPEPAPAAVAAGPAALSDRMKSRLLELARKKRGQQ